MLHGPVGGLPELMPMEYNPSQSELMPPEVSPVDVWGDPEWLAGDGLSPMHALPAKRPPRPHNDDEARPADGPLRIDSFQRPRADTTDGVAPSLEVAEINGRVLRLAPELPVVERVPRQVTFLPRQAGSNGKKTSVGETGEWGRPQRHSLWWLCGIGTAIVAVVVGAMVMLPRVNRANAVEIRPGEMELVIDQIVGDDAPQRISAMMQRLGEAERVFDAYAGARTVDEVLPLLRDPAAVEPLLRAAGWSGLLPRARAGHSWTAHQENEVVYGLLNGNLADHSKFHAYLVDEGDGLRIDWKASAGYSTAGFEMLAEGLGDASEIRGWITPVDFYTLAFPENEYRSYRLLSSDEKVALWVYAETGGEAAGELDLWFLGGQILTSNKEAKKVTLRLARPPPAAMPNQWLLVELLHKEWIAP